MRSFVMPSRTDRRLRSRPYSPASVINIPRRSPTLNPDPCPVDTPPNWRRIGDDTASYRGHWRRGSEDKPIPPASNDRLVQHECGLAYLRCPIWQRPVHLHPACRGGSAPACGVRARPLHEVHIRADDARLRPCRIGHQRRPARHIADVDTPQTYGRSRSRDHPVHRLAMRLQTPHPCLTTAGHDPHDGVPAAPTRSRRCP